MSKNIKSKLESIFAIDTYETSDENRNAPDVMQAHNTLTGKKISIFKDEPLEEGEDDPSLQDIKSICIDFDGVIHPYKKWNGGKLNPDPISGTREAINYLKNKYKIIIFTTRASERYNQTPSRGELVKNVKDWLKSNDIYFDDVTADKIGAVAYIDDKAIRFEDNWNQILKMVDNFK